MTLHAPVQPAAPESTIARASLPWWRLLSRYHWFVFLVASAAWFFDCLDQRLFSLARIPALVALMKEAPTSNSVQSFGKIVTAFFLIGWGVGGLTFGALGDRFGRARMLTLTILTYSVFTGLSFFSQTKVDFAIFRFLTGLGVGGVFGLAVALIAETVPAAARTQSLGMLQVLSTIGNITAGLTKIGIDALEESKVLDPSHGWWGQGWRWMFLVGALPAIMVILTGRYLREPESWLNLKERGLLPKGSILAPYSRLFRERRWRRNLVIGALLASTGVVGLWAIGEYAPDIQRAVFKPHYEARVPPVQIESRPGQTDSDVARARADATKARDAVVKKKVENATAVAYLLNMIGAGTGMWLFTQLAGAAGRRLAFFVGFTAALVVTFFAYWQMKTPTDAYWMMPLMGGAQLGVFAGFAIYLPELFPSAIRSTGTSFCYNLGRFAAAGGSFFSSVLTVNVFGEKGLGYPSPLPSRYSAMAMCVIFFVGMITVAFAPETKGKPLPE